MFSVSAYGSPTAIEICYRLGHSVASNGISNLEMVILFNKLIIDFLKIARQLTFIYFIFYSLSL